MKHSAPGITQRPWHGTPHLVATAWITEPMAWHSAPGIGWCPMAQQCPTFGSRGMEMDVPGMKRSARGAAWCPVPYPAPRPQVLMVRFASLFDVKEQTVTFMSRTRYGLEELWAMGMGDLLGAMFDFSEKLSALELSDEELGLFTAVVLVSAGGHGGIRGVLGGD